MTKFTTMVNSSIQDELVNKLQILHCALEQANSIIKNLDDENHRISILLSKFLVKENYDEKM